MKLTANRRLYPRIPSYCLVHYVQEFPRTEGLGRTVDMGLRGLCIETTQMARATAPIEVTLSISDQLLSLRGTVVRCEEIGEERWEVAILFKEYSRRYMVLLAQRFANRNPADNDAEAA
jgi:hypothetical protein